MNQTSSSTDVRQGCSQQYLPCSTDFPLMLLMEEIRRSSVEVVYPNIYKAGGVFQVVVWEF